MLPSQADGPVGEGPLGDGPVGDVADGGEEPISSGSRMEHRSALLLFSGFATVLLAAAVSLLPVPYVMLRPGPVVNTLGDTGKNPLISVTGHPTYPASGRLDLTTVSLLGGPGERITLWQALGGWMDHTVSVVPEEEIFPKGQTAQQTQQQNAEEMTTSQEAATAAALDELGITVPTTLKVSDVDAKAPAAAAIKAGDVIVGVDGKPTDTLDALRSALGEVSPGQPVTVRVSRSGVERDVQTRTTKGDDGRTVLGVFLDPVFRFPFQVKIEIENIGGPSAGMMFALGIIDVLTPGNLTGGKTIAGTGTIDSDGTVGPIGGIQQKLVGARDAGARWFLAPAGNCSAVVGHVPSGMQVVRVSTLAEARTAVEAIASGTGTDALPGCTAS